LVLGSTHGQHSLEPALAYSIVDASVPGHRKRPAHAPCASCPPISFESGGLQTRRGMARGATPERRPSDRWGGGVTTGEPQARSQKGRTA
jgi:hypothetical protein